MEESRESAKPEGRLSGLAEAASPAGPGPEGDAQSSDVHQPFPASCRALRFKKTHQSQAKLPS